MRQPSASLEKAILQTLAYSDVFDYPLTLNELHRYLVIAATKDEIQAQLTHMTQIGCKDDFYFLSSRDDIVALRQARTEKSKKAFNRAIFYGKILGKLPFVSMVALTGSLAMYNLSKNIDMDYMLITQPKRLWLARAFAVTFGRIFRLAGDRICVNLLISESNLHWSNHDLYSAREICQMIPITGLDTYQNFRIANLWTDEFLPNSSYTNADIDSIRISTEKLERYIFPLQFLESLAMKIQLKIISKRSKTNAETNFSAEICQGNFDQHKKWTQIEYEERIKSLSQRERGRGEG